MSIESEQYSNNYNLSGLQGIPSLWNCESAESSGEKVRDLVESLIANGLPGYDLKKETSFKASLEERIGADSLQFRCILKVAELLLEGKARIHDISFHTPEDVVAFAIEEAANQYLKRWFPPVLVDAFEGKFAYIPKANFPILQEQPSRYQKRDLSLVRGMTSKGNHAIAFDLSDEIATWSDEMGEGKDKVCCISFECAWSWTASSNWPHIVQLHKIIFESSRRLPTALDKIIRTRLLGKPY